MREFCDDRENEEQKTAAFCKAEIKIIFSTENGYDQEQIPQQQKEGHQDKYRTDQYRPDPAKRFKSRKDKVPEQRGKQYHRCENNH